MILSGRRTPSIVRTRGSYAAPRPDTIWLLPEKCDETEVKDRKRHSKRDAGNERKHQANRREKPRNANLPIGVLCFATVANREIGVPRQGKPRTLLRFPLGW